MGIDQQTWSRHAWRNRLQSLLLLSVMGGFMALLGWLLWGREGIVGLLAAAAMVILFNPVISPRLVMRLYGAIPVDGRQLPAAAIALSRLSERAGLPAVPVLHYLPSGMLNAFAVGSRGNSAIAVTDGLLRRLTPRELVSVLAHEVSHIRNNDLWVMGLADLFSRGTSLLSFVGQFLLLLNLPLILFSTVSINWFAIALLVFAPNLSALAQLALSRTREFDADLNAVSLTADPDGLASALAKIERAQGGLWERIFMPGRRVPEPSLLRTHPDTGERIARLMALKVDRRSVPSSVPDPSALDVRSAFGAPVERTPRWHLSGLWH